MKPQYQAQETSFRVVGQSSSSNSPQTIQIIDAALRCLSKIEGGCLLLSTVSTQDQSQMTRNGSNPKSSFLWSSFHSSKKYCESCQGREAIKQPYPAATPMNHVNYQHGNMTKGSISGSHMSETMNSFLIGLKALTSGEKLCW